MTALIILMGMVCAFTLGVYLGWRGGREYGHDEGYNLAYDLFNPHAARRNRQEN
jgi:hypothetical protein